MDEDGLVLALGKVQDAHEQRQLLRERWGRRGAVDDGSREVNEQVEEDGTVGYSTMKTVRQDIWGPVYSCQRFVCRERSEDGRTQVFDVDCALIPQASVVDPNTTRVGDWRPIAALGHSQAVDGKLGGLCELFEDLRC